MLGVVPFVFAIVFFGVPARTHQARIGDKAPRRGTLHAFGWLENLHGYESEARMLAWIRRNIPPGARVAEAFSDQHGAYEFSGRVASLAGRPIPLGWTHHEHIWRGADPVIANNRGIVLRIYNAQTPQQLRQAASELDIRYLVIAKNEIEYFGKDRMDKLYQQALRETADLVASFPADKPEAFVFRLRTE
jgi:uncharacterized membrane protein